MRRLAEYVLGLGHREIALLTMRLGREWPHGGPRPAVADPERVQTPHFHVQRERIHGVYDAMTAAGLDPESLTVVESYEHLHELGHAHSVEAWSKNKLSGGLYGVAVGGAFFGESMFHRVTDASKIAVVALVEHLRAKKFVLLDTQWTTPHLQQFGAIEIPRERYLKMLRRAIELPRKF